MTHLSYILGFTKQVGTKVSYLKDMEHFPIKQFRKFTNISSSQDKINILIKGIPGKAFL